MTDEDFEKMEKDLIEYEKRIKELRKHNLELLEEVKRYEKLALALRSVLRIIEE